jgi:hypothetical protein
MPTEIKIADDMLEVRITGLNKLWSLKSHMEIPLESVESIEYDPEVAREWAGWRIGGTSIPRVITAGNYRKDGEWSFWNVRDPDKTVIICLKDEHYSRLVIQVDDPHETVAHVREALTARTAV